jgi:hypothetical protein
MKTPLVLISLFLVAALLMVGSVAPGGVGRPAAVQAAAPELAAGGRYNLTDGGCQIQQVASGGRYRLWAPAIPAQGTGTPCCCLRVPAVINAH